MSFARVNGAVLHWQATGPADAPPLVFANSPGSDFRVRDAVAGMLVQDYGIIRYDQRGHGLSDLAVAGADVEDHVSDLAALLDHVGISSCALVGLSFGGMIVHGFAARHPDRTRAIVLCDTAVRGGTPEMWTARIAAVQKGGMEAIADAVLQRWLTPAFYAQHPEEIAGWRNMLVRTPPQGYIATCAALADADLSAAAAAIRAPCLCVVGDEDASTPPDLVHQTAALIAGARFEVIDGAGHLPCIEQPGRLAGLIRGHLVEARHG